jgi:alkanesulfonate monooxygenase SsuD/methylene tetrahydromethanopterin reductase-like flavin-dependent oxidoreductase (luciferase family)
MRFGLFIMGTRRGSYQAVLEQVCQAEQLGFDTVVLAERHFQHANLLFPSPLGFGAAIAARTSRIRIATAARILPLAHPIHIAEAAATLDVISNGRLEFGVARASLDEEAHDAFRSPLGESRQRFEEGLEIILRAWTQESISHDGKFYRIPQVSVSPKPLQKPHPPVYVVAVSPQTVAYAARSGHGVYLPGTRTFSELDQTSQHYWKHRHRAGCNGLKRALSINRFIYVSDDDQSARREIEGPFLEFIDQHAPDLKAALNERYAGASLNYDRMVNDFSIFGSPNTVATRLRELHHKLGGTYVLCSLNLITLDHDLCLRSMQLMGSEVIPLLRHTSARMS